MSYDLRSIRPLGKESLRGLSPAELPAELPTIEWVDPATLFIEAAYQREVGGRGIALIRKIYAGFDWALYKPPSCIRHESGVLVCVDGQHTAIAAASHPRLEKIPVMIVSGVAAERRARAFVGHNTERVALTPMAILRAEIAAGDPLAMEIDAACRDTGVTVLPAPVNIRHHHPVGTTIAVGTIRAVAKRHGRALLIRVLKLLKLAQRGPIKAGEIAAAAMILVDERAPPEADLLRVIASKTAEQWAAIAATVAAEDGAARADAIVGAWCRALGIRLTGNVSRETSLPFRPERAKDALAAVLAPTTPPEPEKRAGGPVMAPAAPAKDKPKGDFVKPKGRIVNPATISVNPATISERLAPPRPAQPVGNLEPLGSDVHLSRPDVQLRAPIPPPRPLAKPSGPEMIFERNGVGIDLGTRNLQHRGATVRLSSPYEVRLVAALATAMPEMVDWLFTRKKVYGNRADDGADERLRFLVTMIGAPLATVRLEIKVMPRVGLRLIDLGPMSRAAPA